MRILFIVILVLLGGAFLSSYLLNGDQTLNTREISQVQTNCLECHSAVLRYNSATQIHNIHSTLNCSQCHTESGLKASTTAHSYFEWLGIGLVGLGLVGITTNFIVAHKRIKKG